MSRITEIRAWKQSVRLKRPYTIASGTRSQVDLMYLRLVDDDGHVGLGSASPAAGVTGETAEACLNALQSNALQGLQGEDPRRLGRLLRHLEEHLAATPAARAAADLALHDLFARRLGVPLVDLLGRRRRDPLPTSITLGIQGLEDTLEEAEEYLAQGFRCLKVKIGLDFEQDRERLHRLREAVGPEVGIRVDANQGYSYDDTLRLLRLVTPLDLELVEQPLRTELLSSQRRLPPTFRLWLAADEGVLTPRHAAQLLRPPAACGTLVLKLMKHGGVGPALDIAAVAEASGAELMWGCMDESAISIAAALHAAYACPHTRFLDLDGSFELADDPATGGFELRDGRLHLTAAPGLGVSLRDEA